ncbi:hypothetical protein L596_029409 [Steinernema carpocapsae]|uniref:Uncharacterized protein n=1 Tax=Steinernema carpocapsae TaxID=34508 RepID=A0A4U5LUJ4_STECR|nr:hypothetical protein L596_029409 [Steinernema carpocapsae]
MKVDDAMMEVMHIHYTLVKKVIWRFGSVVVRDMLRDRNFAISEMSQQREDEILVYRLSIQSYKNGFDCHEALVLDLFTIHLPKPFPIFALPPFHPTCKHAFVQIWNA